jgi:hypothetical protein
LIRDCDISGTWAPISSWHTGTKAKISGENVRWFLKQTVARTVSVISLMSKAKRGFNLFGKKKDTGPTLDEQCAKQAEELGLRIETLNKKADYYDKLIEQEKAVVRENHKKNPKKASAAARRIKGFEKQRDTACGIAANLQNQADLIQNAAMNIDAIKSIEANTKLYNQIMSAQGLTPERVAEIQDEAAETFAQAEELAQAVAAPIGPQYDDDEINDEIDAIVAEGEPEAEPANPGRVTAAPAADATAQLDDLMGAFA